MIKGKATKKKTDVGSSIEGSTNISFPNTFKVTCDPYVVLCRGTNILKEIMFACIRDYQVCVRNALDYDNIALTKLPSYAKNGAYVGLIPSGDIDLMVYTVESLGLSIDNSFYILCADCILQPDGTDYAIKSFAEYEMKKGDIAPAFIVWPQEYDRWLRNIIYNKVPKMQIVGEIMVKPMTPVETPILEPEEEEEILGSALEYKVGSVIRECINYIFGTQENTRPMPTPEDSADRRESLLAKLRNFSSSEDDDY